MHDITIPLMGFNGFHHVSSTDSKEEFEDFIGRESIIDKLKGWLYDAREDNRRHTSKYSGAYLITGFRGMGKSSFVHKTINEILTKKNTKKKYVPISINVGNDLLTSRELLYIICKLLNTSFRRNTRIETKLNFKYFFNQGSIFIKRVFRVMKNIITLNWKEVWYSFDYFMCSNLIPIILLLFLGLSFFLFFSIHKDSSVIGGLKTILTSVISLISYIYHFVIEKWFGIGESSSILSDLRKNIFFEDIQIVILILLCLFIRQIFYVLYKMTNSSVFITRRHIKHNFKHILQRIESEMTIVNQNGLEAKIESKSLKSGYHFLKNKNNHYPIAQTTEIQDLLVNQLSLINRLPSSNLRFIFIIDELDKVSPEDIEKQTIPEYEYTNSVKGNSTYRSRQKALAELLANLKFFISSSEAKFVFITGYDMYEATLSDISNREFSIHSIFNGYINVSSFLRKTGTSTGADSMIEEYFCHVLLKKDKTKDNRKDLHDYANFIRETWKQYNQELSEKDLDEFEVLLERRINFLRHFLTYLFYMSNGSPKKLAMYMEKYIRSKKRVIEQIHHKHPRTIDQEYKQISLGNKDCWKKCDWFLYFDIRNIQKIEFVNYLIYPMIKNLIAKSSIYNDKLLVATSFMISNLYKFHKSGFSWRNLEYMPELLEINKMPELRDFIGGIMQFLNQTHIDEATINLYKFKFPQRLSEEITYFSKSSEEISFLFNFSHDELLSIKKLYFQQLEHYSKMEKESPAIASIHHTLGDIYMLEENYEQAIYEFNESLNAISRQENESPKSIDDSNIFLCRIRVSLKLALAYEKRKTFDTAYITYQNIVELILENTDKINPSFLFCTENYIEILKSNSLFFANIRISYLCILAKVAVLEKMDLGGIRIEDLVALNNEFNVVANKLSDELRPVVIIEFFKKLGDILYYKNGVFANESGNKREFSKIVHRFRNQIGLECYHPKKFDRCKEIMSLEKSNGEMSVNPPCIACQCYNKSMIYCIQELNGDPHSYEEESRSIFFIEMLLNRSQDILKKGNTFMLSMANLLVGMGNTLLGCIKSEPKGYYITIQEFFCILDEVFHNGISGVSFDAIQKLKIKNLLDPYSKAILYYFAAAKTYELLTDFKSAYNIYVQILDAVFAYSQAVSKSIINKDSLRFCEILTEQAITCTFLHYDCINCEEIDTQKYELAKRQTDNINLHSLSLFPEIEVVIEKYYHLCLLSKTEMREHALLAVINSRQLGQNKLIATLTQNIQNLYFKVSVNEDILSRMIPKLSKSFSDYGHSLIKTIEYFKDYYINYNLKQLIDNINWKILSNKNPTAIDKMIVLNYLINDTLFCLNRITELIEPLFSTTLYSNAYIGLIYEKIFNWSHLWIAMRELSEYTSIREKGDYLNSFKNRYPPQDIEYYCKLSDLFASFDNLMMPINDEGFNKGFSPGEVNFMTGSYLTGNAIDFFTRSVEMHSSGKTYKEMMPTLFFLEDDLNNDSNYLNLAIERFLLNNGFIQKKINNLKKFSFAKSSLLRIDNYFKR